MQPAPSLTHSKPSRHTLAIVWFYFITKNVVYRRYPTPFCCLYYIYILSIHRRGKKTFRVYTLCYKNHSLKRYKYMIIKAKLRISLSSAGFGNINLTLKYKVYIILKLKSLFVGILVLKYKHNVLISRLREAGIFPVSR